MTKKDFELIAQVLTEYRPDAPETIDAMAKTFAVLISHRNERFNHDLFISACNGN